MIIVSTETIRFMPPVIDIPEFKAGLPVPGSQSVEKKGEGLETSEGERWRESVKKKNGTVTPSQKPAFFRSPSLPRM